MPGPHRRRRSPYEPSDASSFYFHFYAPGANEVFFVSELDNWGEGRRMTRSEDDSSKWEVIVEVPWEADDLLFKFKVDGNWMTSPDYPVRPDGQFENNYTHIPIINLSNVPAVTHVVRT